MSSLRDVRVILFEPDRDFRSVLRSQLRELGFKHIDDLATPESVENALVGGDVDMAIVETRTEEDDLCNIFRDIRMGLSGTNPLPIAIATCQCADEYHMRGVINAGFDSALAKPVDAATMVRRVGHFIDTRMPFVVTHDYIGPDRRRNARCDSQNSARLISVPNPVKIIADGMGRAYLDEQIVLARNELDEEKMVKDGDNIKWLVDRLCGTAIVGDKQAMEQCRFLAAQIREQAVNMRTRSDRTAYANVSDVCVTLAEVALRMSEADRLPSHKDTELLQNLNMAIIRGLQSDGSEDVHLKEIQNTFRAGPEAVLA